MSSYVKITLPNDGRYSINYGLRAIICYIGSSKETYCYSDDTFKRGIKIINRSLNKYHITAIKRLVYGKQNKQGDFTWRFHRKKAEKVFSIILQELKGKDSSPIQPLFLNIYDNILIKIFNDSIKKTGSEIVGRTYIRDLQYKIVDPWYISDREDIMRIVRSIKRYNQIIS